jgi:hypothetical protein
LAFLWIMVMAITDFVIVVCCAIIVPRAHCTFSVTTSAATLGSTARSLLIHGSGFGVNTSRLEIQFTHGSTFQHRNFSAAVLSDSQIILRLTPIAVVYYPFQPVTHKWHLMNGTNSTAISVDQLWLNGAQKLSGPVQVAVVVRDASVRTTHTVIHPHTQQLRIHGRSLDCTDLQLQFSPQLVVGVDYTVTSQHDSLVVLDRITDRDWLLGEYGSAPISVKRLQCHQAVLVLDTEVPLCH